MYKRRSEALIYAFAKLCGLRQEPCECSYLIYKMVLLKFCLSDRNHMLYHKYCFLTKKINYVNIKCLKLNGKSFQYSYYILQSSPSLPVHGEEDTTAQIVGSELIQDVSLCKYSA